MGSTQETETMASLYQELCSALEHDNRMIHATFFPPSRIRDYARVFSAVHLNRFGVLAAGAGHRWLIEWYDGRGCLTSDALLGIESTRQGLRAHLSYYLIRPGDGRIYSPAEPEKPFKKASPVECIIPLELVPTNNGGTRYFMRCPSLRDGRVCGTRKANLFMPRESYRFACFECHQLKHLSQLAHRPFCPLPANDVRIRPYRRGHKFPTMHRPAVSEVWFTHGLRGTSHCRNRDHENEHNMAVMLAQELESLTALMNLTRVEPGPAGDDAEQPAPDEGSNET